MARINDISITIKKQFKFYKKAVPTFSFDKGAVVYALLIFPFLELDGLWTIIGKVVRYGWGLLALVLLCILVFGKCHSIYLDNFNLCFLGYGVVILFSAYLNGSLSFGMIYSFLIIWIVLQGLHYHKEIMLKGMVYIFIFVILMNLISMFWFQEQVYITHLTPISGRFSGILGGRNAFAPSLIPMGNIVLYYFIKKEKKVEYKWGYLFLGLSFLSIVSAKSVDAMMTVRSSTGIVMVLVNMVLLLCRNRLKMPYWLYLGIVLVANIVLAGFYTQIMNSSVVLYILGILHRGNDLSSRTYIWDNAFSYIKQAPFLGNGRGNSLLVDIRKKQFIYGETHNMFLQILYNGGILSLLFYAGACVSAVKKGISNKKAEKILFIALVCFLIGGLTESIQDHFLFWILLGIMNEDGNNGCDIVKGVL